MRVFTMLYKKWAAVPRAYPLGIAKHLYIRTERSAHNI